MTRSSDTTISFTQSGGRLPSEPRATLVFYHREGSKLVSLSSAQALVVGRSAPADIPIADSSLSRQHARFDFEDASLHLEDLLSTNGTRVNGKRISARTRLQEGDEIRLGRIHVAFHILSPDRPRVADLEGYERLLQRLADEVLRTRRFSRSCALLMVRASEPHGPALSSWASSVGALLGELNYAAIYGPQSVLVCMPEAGQAEALTLARAMTCQPKATPAKLRVGIALCPEHGTTADELVEQARRAEAETNAENAICLSRSGRPHVAATDAPIAINGQMRALYETARRIAAADLPVLITGETGSGKELLARAIHQGSARKGGPLRSINCGAIPNNLVESALFGHEKGAFTGAAGRAKGLFEEANGGSVMLDEIGELSANAQTALLRVLETGLIMRVGSARELAVDVRVIAATHRDLEQMAQKGLFRQDLLYRLNTVVLEVPPLRERPDEILPLAETFLTNARARYPHGPAAIRADAAAYLQGYSWPGNVRELRNVVERALVIAEGTEIVPDDFPKAIRASDAEASSAASGSNAPLSEGDGPGLAVVLDTERPLKDQVEGFEAALLREALETHDWNQTHTAKALGMPLRTLVHKIKKYGLQR